MQKNPELIRDNAFYAGSIVKPFVIDSIEQ